MKRPFHKEGDNGLGVLVHKSKRRLTLHNVISHVMRGLSVDEIMSRMEPFIRKVVREELERVILPFTYSSASVCCSPCLNQIEPSGKRADLQLLFVNKLPHTIFTGSRLESEEGGPVKIVLFNPNTNAVVTSSPLSSIKIEILVLDGDFGSDDQANWSEKDFGTNIVSQRVGKRPLLTGNRRITLRDGAGAIGDVVFTDNSSWTRSRKFRIGARAVQKIASELRIKEARSEAFIVKDHRGELYKKHHPPSLNDEIWRLEKIAKDGTLHARLAKYEVHTVKDFLQLQETNPNFLCRILCTSKKNWDTILDHAMECVLDDKLYTYHVAAQGVGLLFNSIFKVVGAAFDGQNFQPTDRLTLPQKLLVESLKQQAYDNASDWVQINEAAFGCPTRPLMQAEQLPRPNLGLLHHDFAIINKDQLESQIDFSFPSTSTSYRSEIEDDRQLETPVAQDSHPMQFLPQMLRNSFRMGELFSIPHTGENGWSPSATRGAIVSSSNHSDFDNLDNSDFQVLNSSPNATWGQETSFFFGSSSESEVSIFSSFPSIGVFRSRIRKPKAAWCKIRAAIKWDSVRRNVAARRMAMPFFVNY
ncbi:Calmodulin_bind domain-containing protein [Cephalotus follicularis]|uniref:Calmodulin_bind domain-containing protein n=1 Tax=Cephalotus follicularis TaxID=3775 RepID=A0A1Q3B0J5_CEPFO|nr:Calmodulin_bind domain-containing protein [Cephalotus follicularis]